MNMSQPETQSAGYTTSKTVEATSDPPSGLWRPTQLQYLYYGSGCVDKHLEDTLPSGESKVCIITGNSLKTKTNLVKQVEDLLGPRHAITFAGIGEHAPEKALNEATDKVLDSGDVSTIISIGGGSPIDSAKIISYNVHEKTGKWPYHITIPTTLSAAECTSGAGYTTSEGIKKAIPGNPEQGVRAIFYDSKFGLETPPDLLLSTGLRGLDHAIEMLYHPTATELCKAMCLQAAGDLFKYLPQYKANPKDETVITKLFLAAFASLGYFGLNVKPPLGLSHSLGYALGSPYKIPHGVTSCITLGRVVKLKAKLDKRAAAQIARVLPFIGATRSGDDVKDGDAVGDKIMELVRDIGQATTLTEKGVGEDQVGIIIERSTGMKGKDGAENPKFYEEVEALVKALY